MPLPHTCNGSAAALRQRDAGEECRADQQRLLQDQQEGCRDYIARVAADRVEDWLQQYVGGARAGQRRLDEAAVRARAAAGEFRRQRVDRDRNAARQRSEKKQVGGVGVDRNVGRDALEHVALGAGRDADGGEGVAAVDQCPRVCERAGAGRDADRAARVERLDDAAAKLALVGVDDHDRQLAQDLVEIRLWVIDAVDQRRGDQ
jgi:hypothetical protein